MITVKKILKRLFLALFKEELEELEKEIFFKLLNDASFIHDLSQEIIEQTSISDEIEENLKVEIERLDARIIDLEEIHK